MRVRTIRGLLPMLGAAAALALFVGQAAHAEDFPPNSTMARLAKAGEVRVGVKFDQPGLGLKDLSGKPQGFDIEIAKMIAAGLGIKPDHIHWVETVAANREPFLSQGKVDYVVANYLINAKRMKTVTFAGPYLLGGLDLAVKKGNSLGIKGPDDLVGKKACMTNGGSSVGIFARKYPKVQVVAFDVQSKCFEALKNGSVAAVSSPNFIMAGYVTKDPAVEQLHKPFTHEKYGVGLKKGEVEFCKFIKATLQKAAADGSYKKAWAATLGKIGMPEQPAPEMGECQ